MQLKDHPAFRKLIGEVIPEEVSVDEPTYKLVEKAKKAASKFVCLKCRTYCPCDCGDNLLEV